MPLLNFTDREDIDSNLIDIDIDESAATLIVFLKTKQVFRQNEHFVGGNVILEAHMGVKAQRVDLGPIEGLGASNEVHFDDFVANETPSFCLKIVAPGNKKILGIAKMLSPKNKPEKDEDADKKPLLPVNWANESDNMQHRFWKVGLEGSYPILLLQRGKFTSLGQVNQAEFQALAFPQILTEILSHAFIVHFANPPSWSDDWEKLVYFLGAEPRPILERSVDGTPPTMSAIEDYLDSVRIWIDQIADRFAADQKLMRIDSQFKRR